MVPRPNFENLESTGLQLHRIGDRRPWEIEPVELRGTGACLILKKKLHAIHLAVHLVTNRVHLRVFERHAETRCACRWHENYGTLGVQHAKFPVLQA